MQFFLLLFVSGAFFIAWLWSFPLFGPVPALLANSKNINITALYLAWLTGHTTSLFFYGLWYRKKPTLLPHLSMQASALMSSLGTLGFLVVPGNFQLFLAVVLGMASAPFLAGFGVYLSYTCPGSYRGRALGLTLVIAVLLHLFFITPFSTALSSELLTVLVSIFPLAAATSLYFLTRFFPAKSSEKSGISIWISNPGHPKTGTAGPAGSPTKTPDPPNAFWLVFIVLILGFYAVGGFMYDLVYPELVPAAGFSGTAGILCYLPAAAAGGWLADTRGSRLLSSMALAVEGFGFLFLVSLSNPATWWLTLGLMQFGFAWMDLFVWLTLADLGEKTGKAPQYLGFGLAFNVGAITLASGLAVCLSRTGLSATHLPLAAVGLLFALIPVTAVLEGNRQELRSATGIQAAADSKIPTANRAPQPLKERLGELPPFLKNAGLTPRETEIVLLLLSGKNLTELQKELSISRNTIKTHLRNIYQKTGTSGQKELFLRAWQDVTEGYYN